MRIGMGYDIHRLVEDRKLLLGGVEIPYVKGLLGYSDGDVVLHALSDAMLGAISAGDIGEYFPNTDPQFRDMSSSQILRKVFDIVSKKNFAVNNVDIVVLAEEPKIHPFKEKMIEMISSILGLKKDSVNINATTNEGVGSIGRGDAIASYAVVTLTEK